MSPAQEEFHVLWLSGMSCDGCTAAAVAAQNPTLEQLTGGTIPRVPRIHLHHAGLAEQSGEAFMAPYRRALAGGLGAPYLIVLEGSVPDDQALGREHGYYAALGAGGAAERHSGDEQPVRVSDWLKLLAPGAAATIAIGTCATWGGIPAAAGNVTGSMSLMDYLGPGYRSARGLPVINVPGCAPVGDNFTETLSELLLFLAGEAPQPEFDQLGRPQWLFGETVHHHCPKAGYYEEGVFSQEYGDTQCLVEVGCWGPVVQCNIVERGAFNHMGGCMVAGGACIGCTMPGFPDRYSPFYKAPPGSTVSGTMSKTYGGAIRRLRRMSMRSGNREPLWDNLEMVPSPWARELGARTPVDRTLAFFYKRLQYAGTVNQAKRNKHQPAPETLDILRKDGRDLNAPVPVLGERVKPREEI